MAEEDIKKIFKGTIAVHLTDFLPKKKRIRTRFSIDPRKWFRDTVHFTLNKPVQDLSVFMVGGTKPAIWSDKKFCILIPFDRLYELNGKNLQLFTPDDTFFTRSVILPDGTIILAMPIGFNDLINGGIISNEELSSNFAAVNKPKFFEKDKDGIIYRIFNPSIQWEITKVAINTIVENGYSPKFFNDKNINQINEALGLEAVAHYIHWTSNLEEFLISIHVHKNYLDNILSVLVKTEGEGIVFPIKKNTGAYGDFLDSKDKQFRFIGISGLTTDERHAAECLEWSMLDPEKRSSLQFPFEHAKSLLKSKEVPLTYHNAIKFYIKDYQDYVKKKLPREILILCPMLSEFLEERF